MRKYNMISGFCTINAIGEYGVAFNATINFAGYCYEHESNGDCWLILVDGNQHTICLWDLNRTDIITTGPCFHPCSYKKWDGTKGDCSYVEITVIQII